MTNVELADWIVEHLREPSGYPDGSVIWRINLSDAKVEQIVASLRSDAVRLRNLVQTLLDNDPSEPIADNGMTVFDGWRDDARRLLSSDNAR